MDISLGTDVLTLKNLLYFGMGFVGCWLLMKFWRVLWKKKEDKDAD
jgi:hypothetical protein